jgi:hypothetical protein
LLLRRRLEAGLSHGGRSVGATYQGGPDAPAGIRKVPRMIFLYIISIIVYIALIFITMNIASNKNRSPLGFGLLAVFIPIIALIIVLIINPGKPGASLEQDRVE